MCYVYDVAEENKSFDSVIKAWFLQQQHLKLVKLFFFIFVFSFASFEVRSYRKYFFDSMRN